MKVTRLHLSWWLSIIQSLKRCPWAWRCRYGMSLREQSYNILPEILRRKSVPQKFDERNDFQLSRFGKSVWGMSLTETRESDVFDGHRHSRDFWSPCHSSKRSGWSTIRVRSSICARFSSGVSLFSVPSTVSHSWHIDACWWTNSTILRTRSRQITSYALSTGRFGRTSASHHVLREKVSMDCFLSVSGSKGALFIKFRRPRCSVPWCCRASCVAAEFLLSFSVIPPAGKSPEPETKDERHTQHSLYSWTSLNVNKWRLKESMRVAQCSLCAVSLLCSRMSRAGCDCLDQLLGATFIYWTTLIPNIMSHLSALRICVSISELWIFSYFHVTFIISYCVSWIDFPRADVADRRYEKETSLIRDFFCPAGGSWSSVCKSNWSSSDRDDIARPREPTTVTTETSHNVTEVKVRQTATALSCQKEIDVSKGFVRRTICKIPVSVGVRPSSSPLAERKFETSVMLSAP